MVTHEPDIASYSKRNIVMRDGKVQKDRAVKQRLFAEEEFGELKAEDEP
jgi:putative ABC transport system ATP-binding protein